MKAKNITAEEFKSHIFDFDKEGEWKFKGCRPAIIDFYADWCGPCKMIAPILDELAMEYDGKVDIYKVDTEVEQELSEAFGISAIPAILFIPLQGLPAIQRGAIPKNAFKEVIEKRLLMPDSDLVAASGDLGIP